MIFGPSDFNNKIKYFNELEINGEVVDDDDEDYTSDRTDLDEDDDEVVEDDADDLTDFTDEEFDTEDDETVEGSAEDDVVEEEPAEDTSEEDAEEPADDEPADEGNEAEPDTEDDETVEEPAEDDLTDFTDEEFDTEDDTDEDPDSQDDTAEGENTETDEGTETNTDDADDDEAPASDESDNTLAGMEKNLFSDLSPQQLAIKNTELLHNYIELYETINTIFDNVNKIPKTHQNTRPLIFITDQLVELKDMVNYVITTTYVTKTYVENMAYYKQALVILQQLNTMLKALVQKPAK